MHTKFVLIYVFLQYIIKIEVVKKSASHAPIKSFICLVGVGHLAGLHHHSFVSINVKCMAVEVVTDYFYFTQ